MIRKLFEIIFLLIITFSVVNGMVFSGYIRIWLIIQKISTLLISPEQLCDKLVRVFIPSYLKIEKLPAFKPVSNKFNFLRYGEKISQITESVLVKWWDLISSAGEPEHKWSYWSSQNSQFRHQAMSPTNWVTKLNWPSFFSFKMLNWISQIFQISNYLMIKE